MRRILALIRIDWLTFSSYRLNVVFSALGLIALYVPVYLISRPLQPIVASSIADEGEAYFGFLISGLAILQVVGMSMRGLPGTISSGISSGTLEALFATPTRLPTLLAGMMGYSFLWAVGKAVLLLAGIPFAGGEIHPSAIPLAAIILLLLVLAHVPIGILAASAIMVFRTTGPFLTAALAATSLLGGVYYSTSVIPEVVRPLAAVVPLTYGLRAFRRSLLSGEPFSEVAGDVAILAIFAVVLTMASLAVFRLSIRQAQRTGSLSQY